MDKTQRIKELERQLVEVIQKNVELEIELKELRQTLSKQVWNQDRSISGDEWLKNTSTNHHMNEIKEHKEKENETRVRTKTIIDTSVIENLRISKEEIQLKEHIGKGSFGIVWKAVHRDKTVAVKVFISEEVDVSREISTMAKTQGLPHVLDLIGIVLEEDDPYKPPQIALVMKYMSNGSLQDICYRDSNSYHSNLSNEMKIKFSYQAAKGVHNLHTKSIIHRDLACRNLLVDDKLDVYVADFGFARLKHVTTSKEFTLTKLGPVRWEAPESLERKEYSEKTDSFSFGVCIYEIITGKQPWDFCTTPTMVALNVLQGRRLQLPLNCDPVLADIAWQCWSNNPLARPSFHSIIAVLSDRYKEVIEDTRETIREFTCIEFMLKGVDVLKYPFILSDESSLSKLKKPQSRYLRITSNLTQLVWRSSAANSVFSSASRNRAVERGIQIREIFEVKIGHFTENFKLQISTQSVASASCSFSLITANRTVDITCESSAHRDQWVWGIRYLLHRQEASRSTSNPLINQLRLAHVSSQHQSGYPQLDRSASLQSLSFPLPSPSLSSLFFESHEYLTILRHLVYRLQRGDIVSKFKSNRKLHVKRVFLSQDLTELIWNMQDDEDGNTAHTNKKNKNRTILLSEIENISYDPPNSFLGNSRVASIAAGLSEKLNLRRPNEKILTQAGINSLNVSDKSPSFVGLGSKKERGSVEGVETGLESTKKSRPRKPSLDSTGTAGPPQSSTWMQNLIPSLKREKSDDPYNHPTTLPNSSSSHTHAQPHSQPEQLHGSVISEDSIDSQGRQDDIDYQYCVSYLRYDGRVLLAIQCPNREVFEMWTDGLLAILTCLKANKNKSMTATYNSGTEFDIRTTPSLFDQPSFQSFQIPHLLSAFGSDEIDESLTSEITETVQIDDQIPLDRRDTTDVMIGNLRRFPDRPKKEREKSDNSHYSRMTNENSHVDEMKSRDGEDDFGLKLQEIPREYSAMKGKPLLGEVSYGHKLIDV